MIFKLILGLFVVIIVLYALYVTYTDIIKNIPKEMKKIIQNRNSENINNENSENFQEPNLKIILYHATWCGYCVKYLKENTFLDTYDNLKTQNKYDKVTFVQLDFDKNKSTATKYNISSFPTIIAISAEGDLINTFDGDRSNPTDLEKFTLDSLSKL